MAPLPHALDKNFPLFALIPTKKPVVFLDYDGTLTPIVGHPSQAALSPKSREILAGLARKTTVAILSGRAREEVEDLVGIPGLYYGGAHGFDLKGPGVEKIPEEVVPILPSIQEAVKFFASEIEKFPGSWIEDKKFILTLHYRAMDPRLVASLKKRVEKFVATHPHLTMSSGKQIFELRPKVKWDKGSAILYLLKTLHLDGAELLPIFLGDDQTDEDGFHALNNRGWGIVVDPNPGKTTARAYLRSPEEVELFLEKILKALP